MVQPTYWNEFWAYSLVESRRRINTLFSELLQFTAYFSKVPVNFPDSISLPPSPFSPPHADYLAAAFVQHHFEDWLASRELLLIPLRYRQP